MCLNWRGELIALPKPEENCIINCVNCEKSFAKVKRLEVFRPFFLTWEEPKAILKGLLQWGINERNAVSE
jgi:hypothetical protein